jgi:hypothetical protein
VPSPSLRKLTGVFLRVGNTTFGGGLPTMAALQRELVDENKWLSMEDYALAFSLARVTPGTNVIAFCAATGARIMGWRGALAATLAETGPSAVLAILMTQGYETWRSNAWVMAGVYGEAPPGRVQERPPCFGHHTRRIRGDLEIQSEPTLRDRLSCRRRTYVEGAGERQSASP